MKANQAFKANDEAVSPVIGVILMVAITVVLAAVVFVLVSNLSKNSNQSAPNISFSQDKSAKTLTVISADVAKWSDITASFSAGTGCGQNAPTTGSVSAGDKITVTGSTILNTCTLKLVYTPANQLLGTWDFT
jgi:flagellin-like protein